MVERDLVVLVVGLHGARRLRRVLEPHGYTVREAGTPGEAIRSCTNEHADLLVLDPSGETGTESSDAVRRLCTDPVTAGIPVVVVLPRGCLTDRIRALWSGARNTVTTPLHVPEVLQVVESLVPAGTRQRVPLPHL